MRKYLHHALIILSIFLLLATIGIIGLQIYGNKLIENAGRFEEWDDTNGTVITNLCYGPKTLHNYDLYLPTTPSKALMLFIHGGSWMSGNKEEGEWFCRRYAKMGYATATMNYSLLSPQDPTACMPRMLKEINNCINHIKGELKSRGHEVSQMAIAGYSAGAHLALLYANKEKAHAPLPIRFCVNMVGPTDLRYIFKVNQSTLDSIYAETAAGRTHPEKESLDALAFYAAEHTLNPATPCTAEYLDSLLCVSSPLCYISATSTPCIMAYGANDVLVSKEHHEQLLEAYKTHNIDHQFILYPNSDHLLANDTLQTRMLHEAIVNFATKYFEK